MSFKRYYQLFLLLLGIVLYNTGQSQDNIIKDSLTFVQPPIADSALQADNVYDEEEYESQESPEDSVHRAETNAFDTLNAKTRPVSGRKLPDDYITNLKKDDAFDYVKEGIPQPHMDSFWDMSFLLNDIWIYIAILVLILLLAWYLVANKLLFFRKKTDAIQSGSSGELLKDIFSIDYVTAIKEALNNKNYRLAIRLHYLQLLKTLSEKGLIHYQPDKTNFDYLMQTRSTPHYSDFSGLTRQYEYSWYGHFPINQAQYEQVDQLFAKFYKKIGGY